MGLWDENAKSERGKPDRLPSFCVLFAMNHEIIYNSVRKIT